MSENKEIWVLWGTCDSWYMCFIYNFLKVCKKIKLKFHQKFCSALICENVRWNWMKKCVCGDDSLVFLCTLHLERSYFPVAFVIFISSSTLIFYLCFIPISYTQICAWIHWEPCTYEYNSLKRKCGCQ